MPTGGGAGAGKDPTLTNGPAAPIPGAQKGGIVNVISVAGLNTMDPTEAYYTNTYSILSGLVARSLTQYVYRDGQMVLIPDLATDLGTPNADFTSWKFTIRDGVKWENGTPVTAADVKYGIERSFDRSSFPEGAAYSNEYFLNGDTYEGPYKSGTNYPGVIVKGNTLTIKMSQPFPDMPYWGAFSAMGPIPKGDVSAPGKYALHPWSTGPYMFDKYVPEKSLTLKRNPNWDPKTDPGRHAYPDGYNMKFDVPTAKIDQIMLQDEPTTLSYDNVSSDDYISFKQNASDRLVVGSTPCTRYWAPDYRKITDINVRKALAYAYPYADVYAATGLIPGVTRSYGTNLMPPGIPGRKTFNPLPDHQPGSTDTAKAKALLQKAGKMGYEIKFLYSTDDPLSVNGKDQIVKSLEASGFKATPVATNTTDYSTQRADPNAPINVRDVGWCSDWPSGASWFPPLMGTTDLTKEGLGSNYGAFSEPAVDAKIKSIQMLKITDQPAAWNALDKFIQTKYFPIFVTGYYGAAMMRGSAIQGFNDDNVSGMPTWKDISLSK
ncbi:MAG: ABC transporter substrate-binding protein [Nocardioidaceae bacterium]